VESIKSPSTDKNKENGSHSQNGSKTQKVKSDKYMVL